LCFEEFVRKFNLSSYNETYLHYLTLCLAITESWENVDSLSNQPHTSIDLLRIAKENVISNCSVTKKVYLHLTNSTFPKKQQLGWADEFSLNPIQLIGLKFTLQLITVHWKQSYDLFKLN